VSDRNLDRIIDVVLALRGGVIRDIPIVVGDSLAIAGVAVCSYTHHSDRNGV
jgi:hypothetical protein